MSVVNKNNQEKNWNNHVGDRHENCAFPQQCKIDDSPSMNIEYFEYKTNIIEHFNFSNFKYCFVYLLKIWTKIFYFILHNKNYWIIVIMKKIKVKCTLLNMFKIF